MENNKTLYTSFTKLAVKVATTNDYSLKKAKSIVASTFENHVYENIIFKIYRQRRIQQGDITYQTGQRMLECL